jgi:hypothetical protein
MQILWSSRLPTKMSAMCEAFIYGGRTRTSTLMLRARAINFWLSFELNMTKIMWRSVMLVATYALCSSTLVSGITV